MEHRRLIRKTLEKLSVDEFKKFQRELEDRENFNGQDPLAKADLENKDRSETTDKILNAYPEIAVQIIANILEELNQKALKKEFLDNAKSNGAAGSGPVAAASVPATPKGATASDPKVDFVNKHRSDLIQRVTMVDAILDLLVDEGIMKAEDYGDVRAAPTSVKKMRELFILLDKRGKKAKRVFYDGLEKHDNCLLDDLKSE